MIWQLIVIAILAYLLGSVNLSIILSKVLGKGDIREQGSGNAGTTNALRVLGKWPAVVVLVFDILKAVVAVFLGKWIATIGMSGTTPEIVSDLAMAFAGFGVILGHNFPIYYGFKGGKGVATSLGVILTIEWPIGVVCLVFAITVMVLSRMVSLGSISAAILYPVLVLLQGSAIKDKFIYIGFAMLIAALIIFRHRTNIERLMKGTENKLWKTKKEKQAELK